MNNETDKISEERIAVRIDRKSDLYFGIVLVVVGLVAAVFTAIRKNNWLAFAADVVIVALGAFQAVRWFVGRKNAPRRLFPSEAATWFISTKRRAA